MSIDLASVMRRALEHTRAQNPNEATAVIQAALAGHCPLRERPGAAGISSPPASGTAFSLLDLDADTVEPTPLAYGPRVRAAPRLLWPPILCAGRDFGRQA